MWIVSIINNNNLIQEIKSADGKVDYEKKEESHN